MSIRPRATVGWLVAVAVGLLGVAGLTGLTGCGTAEAKPIEVTYYYLPG